VIVKEHR